MMWMQGLSRLGDTLGQGIEAWQKRRDENQKALSKAKAVEGYIKNNPQLFGGEEAVKMELDTNPNESPMQRFERLNAKMEATIFGEKLKGLQQEAAERQRKMEEAQRAAALQQATQQRLQALGQFMQQQSVPTGPAQPGGPALAAPGRPSGPMALGRFMQDVNAGGGVLQPQRQQQLRQASPDERDAASILRTTGQLPTPPTMVQLREQRMAAAMGGPNLTGAMRDTEAIIASELEAGKLKPDGVQARRAVLLAAGGREPSSRFDFAGTFVDNETGASARSAVKDRNTGMIGYVDPKGSFQPLDPAKWKPSTVGDTNAFLDPTGMEKLREKVISGERSVRQLGRYLDGFENLEQGVGQLADRVTKNMKTLFTKEPLTEEEKAVGVQQGRLQQILGGLRVAVVGPGVMTEQDAQRIIDAVGGDVSTLQNQEVVANLLGEILREKVNEYESDLDIFNTHVVRKYGGQAGYKQREKVMLPQKAAKAAEKAAAAEPTALTKSTEPSAKLPPGWSVRR